MKIYDISQEVFKSKVYPGDPKPEKKILNSIDNNDLYNLTEFSMCAHNGTHVDAPYHFINDGKTIDQVNLESFVGLCYVVEHNGDVTGVDAENIINKAKELNTESFKRILIKGEAVVTLDAAKVFASSGILLLGNESQTVGPEDSPMEVHKALLSKDIILLEGIVLNDVPECVYLLNAAPLNLSGSDGAPCRAILIEVNKDYFG